MLFVLCLHAESQCGIAGDWLVAPSVEGAALSGLAMAEAISAHAAGTATASVGLGLSFRPVSTAAIGAGEGSAAGHQGAVPCTIHKTNHTPDSAYPCRCTAPHHSATQPHCISPQHYATRHGAILLDVHSGVQPVHMIAARLRDLLS